MVALREPVPGGPAAPARHALADADWGRLKGLLPTRGPEADHRRFVGAVPCAARTGVPWRDRPDRFGNGDAVYKRFDR